MEQTKKKLDVSQLEIGMYVCELDRPWLETPFLLQGFPLRTPEDIAEVRNVCEYVYIDVALGKDSMHSIPAEKVARILQKQMEKIPEPNIAPRYPVTVALEKEIKKAENIQVKTRGLVQKYLDDLRTGKSITPDNAKEVVTEVVDSIVHNPSALMCYTLLQNRDERTSDHSMNVCILSLAFGRYLGLPEDELNELGIAALLHDLGKVKIPMEVLHKKEKLTDEEFNIIRQHPVHGRTILENANGKVPQTVIDVAYSHHERANGRGYPQGLFLKDLHLFVKMVAIVDVYDAITSDRSYHDGISSHEALKRMYEWRETDFDSGLLEKFIQCLGIYPIGTIVELNTGDVGVVVEVDPRHRLKPRVMLIMDPDKQLRPATRIIDLAMDRISFTEEDTELEIARVLDPGVYDGNIMKAVFESELMKFKSAVA